MILKSEPCFVLYPMVRLKRRLSIYVLRLKEENLLDDSFQLNPDARESIREVPTSIVCAHISSSNCSLVTLTFTP